ncbi:MAG TPA: TauD/TfdA family dioxygenase [Polyangiales bacterium]|nr:TauD/TfdA family dioxygenase [Polyangiales bacterium]
MNSQSYGELPAFVRPGAALSEHLPLIVFPQSAGPAALSSTRAARVCIDRYLPRTGCMLFRAFGIDGPEHFVKWVDAFGFEPSDPVRSGTQQALGLSSPSHSLLARSERRFALQALRVNGHAQRPLLWLYCATPRYALEESLIADHRELYRRLSLSIRTRFLSRGLLYRRTFASCGRYGWAEHFGTTDRATIEASCRREGVSVRWTANGDCALSWRCPALLSHPVTRENVCHNCLLSCLSDGAEPAPLGNQPGLEVRYGDGSQITNAELENVRAAFEASASVIPLERGDVLLIDPLLIWHAQVPYLLDLMPAREDA